MFNYFRSKENLDADVQYANDIAEIKSSITTMLEQVDRNTRYIDTNRLALIDLSTKIVSNNNEIADSAADIVINTLGIEENSELLQTKPSTEVPAIDNSLLRFDGTDGSTVQSSNIVVDDEGSVGIGTETPGYKIDIRTPGVIDSQIHLSSDITDAGAYIGSSSGDSMSLLAGSSVEAPEFLAKNSSASGLLLDDGAASFIGDTGLTPGVAYGPTELSRFGNSDAAIAALAPTLIGNSTYARLVFPINIGFGAPSFNTRSTGAKLVLYPYQSAFTTDLAIGIEGGAMWFGQATAEASSLFKWYGGITEIMRLQGDGELLVKAGGASGFAKVGGVIFDHYTDANNSGTAETDLYTDTIPANALNNNGDKISASYQVVCNGAALSSQQMRLYFGGTLIYDSGALSLGAITSNFTFEVLVIRVSSSVVRCSVAVSSDFATLFPYSKYTEVTGLTLTNTQVLKITGTAAGAAGGSNQITAKLGAVNWMPEV